MQIILTSYNDEYERCTFIQVPQCSDLLQSIKCVVSTGAIRVHPENVRKSNKSHDKLVPIRYTVTVKRYRPLDNQPFLLNIFSRI